MFHKAVAAVFLLIAPSSIYSASLVPTPTSHTTDRAFTIEISADDLSAAAGMDIRITWDGNVIECASAIFDGSALQGFSEFDRIIDNDAGYFEIVLLNVSKTGYSGASDSLLVLHFDPVSAGTTDVYIAGYSADEDPVIIDTGNNSIEVTTGFSTVIVTETEPTPVVTVLRLHQNYPNPFNPETTIGFDIPRKSHVTLKIFDIGGRHVRTLIWNVVYEVGTWETRWDGTNDAGSFVQSGIYFCVLEADGKTDSRKLVVLR